MIRFDPFEDHLERVSQRQKSSLIVSSEDYREVGDEDADPTQFRARERKIWRKAHETFEELLARPDILRAVVLIGVPGAGKRDWLAFYQEPNTVYFSATLVRRQYRRDLVRIARNIQKPVEAVWLRTPLEECIERSSQTGRAVPEEIIRRMSNRLIDEPITLSEGFSQVTQVPPLGPLGLEHAPHTP